MPQATAPAASTAEMPLGSLSLQVRRFRRADEEEEGAAAASGDGEQRSASATFELVFSTGQPVRRYDWVNGRYYMEELVVTPEAINLSRLERGAPLLNSHWAYSLEDQIGVCDQPAIDGGTGTVQAQLSRRDSVRGVVQDLEDRVIRNVSVGYSRESIEMVAPASEENGMWVYRVTRWTPVEVSLVPIPADIDAQVRSADGRLPDGRQIRTYPCVLQTSATRSTPNPAAGSAAEPSQPQGRIMPGTTAAEQQRNNAPADDAAVQAARTAGAQAERQRQADIRTAVQAARSTLGATDADALATRLIDGGIGIDEARREVLEALTQRSQATASRGAADVQTTRDEADTLRLRMQDALVLRVRPGATTVGGRAIDAEGARNFRGMSLVDMGRHCIRAAGGNSDGMSYREISLAALNLDNDATRAAGMVSTSDFPAILGNTVNRSLRAAYELAPRTFTGWARRSTNKDFREKAVLQLGGMSAFNKVNEGGEYKAMTFAESSEKYSLAKYGGVVPITWETLVNDDLSAFDRIPQMIAEEAAGLESDLVYAILTGNPNMADNKALFSADHANLAGAGAAITADALTAGRAAMRKQVGLNKRQLNLAPGFLIVGPDNEGDANKYTSSQFVAAKSLDINPSYNTSLEVVVDGRLEGKQWFLSAGPGRIDTVEYAYLEGEEGLFTERKEGFQVDGVLIKARHVFAAKAIDWRGLYKNPGA